MRIIRRPSKPEDTILDCGVGGVTNCCPGTSPVRGK